MTIKAPGVSKEQLKSSMTRTLAKTYSVNESEVIVQVREYRRLAGQSSEERRLVDPWQPFGVGGNFAVSFTVKVHSNNAAAADAVTKALKKDTSSLHADLKDKLKSLGVSEEALNAMEVSAISITVTRPEGIANTTTSNATSNEDAEGTTSNEDAEGSKTETTGHTSVAVGDAIRKTTVLAMAIAVAFREAVEAM